MDTILAFFMGSANRGRELMVFDWVKAAEIIKEKGADTASAGLCGDWEYTGGTIFEGGGPINQDDTYVYLASTWATPELEVNGELFDCFIMQSESPNSSWDSDTFWPEEALQILNKLEKKQ